MNASFTNKRGSGLRRQLAAWAWLYAQHDSVTTTAVAVALRMTDRQARRTLARLEGVGAVERIGPTNRPLWVALDVVPT